MIYFIDVNKFIISFYLLKSRKDIYVPVPAFFILRNNKSPPLFNFKIFEIEWRFFVMKYEVDSYILEYFESENKYFISFKDSVGTNCRLEISKEIFDEYMFSKKCYVKIKNEKIRHIVYENYSDEELYEKQFNVEESVEEKVIKKITQEQIRQALKELTETQYRRINLHIVNKFTIEDLAKIEKVRTNQIEKSLKMGLKKIKNFFEK